MDLLRRLEQFRIDDTEAPRVDFVSKLAKENGWSQRYAARVVDEYKRFLYLAMTAGHVVCPSEDIDQAWHLHLVYTRSYWERLCGELLGTPLHHTPSTGGARESAAYRDLYVQTLASYERAFGAAPPNDIWPSPPQRFGRDLQRVRVNRQGSTILPRALVAAIGAMLVAAVLCAVAVAGME